MIFVLKNDEFILKNVEFLLKHDDLCIKQAQYFWAMVPQPNAEPDIAGIDRSMPGLRSRGSDDPRCDPEGKKVCALCGDIIPVKANDLITTKISYDGTAVMHASIESSGGGGASTIEIPRPFPNDPTLYVNTR